MSIPILDLAAHLSISDLTAVISLRETFGSPLLTREDFIHEMGLEADMVCIPEQVHSATVRQADRQGIFNSTDGLVTRRTDLFLSLQVADCIPLFLVDTKNRILGLIHAGWRGAAAGIIENSIKQMQSAGAVTSDLKALIGPSIRQESFEVGPEVAEQFSSQFRQAAKGDRWQLDLPGFAIHELQKHGVLAGNIIDMQLDSFMDSRQYHSYRRDGKTAGRMRALLGWNRNQ